MDAQFHDRADAGGQLSEVLTPRLQDQRGIVLALPRGGVPIGAMVARSLGWPLDVMIVRKLGVPWQPELAMGAVASGDVVLIDRDLMKRLGISNEQVAGILAAERAKVRERSHMYRDSHLPPDLHRRTVLLVDDGLATGWTMKAAVDASRKMGAAKVIVAVPVGPASTCEEMRAIADEVICLSTPEPFFGVGQWYEDFSQVTDEQVRQILDETRRTAASGAAEKPAHAGR